MAGTKTTLLAKIADDLERSDLSTQIETAVVDAIDAYKNERFWFNESYRASVTLSSSVAFIAMSTLPNRYLEIDRLRVNLSTNNDFDMIQRDYHFIMARQDGVSPSLPTEFAVYGDKIQFDSKADQNYTLILDGLIDLSSAASASYSASSSASWFSDARNLIRARAKWDIYLNILKDEAMATAQAIAEQRAYSDLKSKTNQRNSSGKIRPTSF